ncbi:MAG: hypothetical protein LBK53_08160 [Heliobacteriaceae bacterium]|jgi:hypothetical protein|nr:hypothetical protein [Heliobacteriaceae bacterium]
MTNLEPAIYAMNNFNAVLGSTLTYMNQTNAGVPSGYALSNFGYNIYNGTMRNAIAHNMYNYTGSTLGHQVNIFAGYGNPASNFAGTVGLMGAMLPYSFGYSPFYTPSLYGGGFLGGGFCGFPGGGFMRSMFYNYGCFG